MTGPGEIKLEDGELVTYGGMGLLWYTGEKLGNCRIRVVFKPTVTLPALDQQCFGRVIHRKHSNLLRSA